MSERQKPQRIDVLASKKMAFAQASSEAADIFNQFRNQNSAQLATLERAFDQAVDLISSLDVQAQTPRHVHGDTMNYNDRKEIYSEEYVHQKNDYSTGHIVHNEVTVEQPSERMYKVSNDLVLSTSGQFVFRPQSKKLMTAAGPVDLSEQEASRLLSFLSFDFGL
ncbi:hypothetical protein M0L20_13750 [Spirosoma sp. RP8]|uniref:Uncharacterized protein n=1 Tax=Spirosoma liriopis TaxID=2937440 RepID=A0ABT0HL96_9BACT|nr:hypothetical protein [Spirosoma liriopis]MCK8492927.1 hypothetical protein [Spirosoma liriopis]